VAEEDDYEIDGDVDYSGTQRWDGHKLIHWEWDVDGDGDIDDSADYTWEPEGTGWHVTSEGEDPNGWYRSDEWWDEEFRQTRYAYADSTGYEYQWEADSWSVAGIVGDVWTKAWADGDLLLDVTTNVVFDELGRWQTIVTNHQELSDGNVDFAFVGEDSYSYTCP
jgi:hypothetical protein